MQTVKDNIKFTQASTPKTNTVKTVKANAAKSNHVEFVEAAKTKSEKDAKQNTFKDMITKTSTQTKQNTPVKTSSAIMVDTQAKAVYQTKIKTNTNKKTSTSTKTGSSQKTNTTNNATNTDDATKSSSSTKAENTKQSYSIKFVSPTQKVTPTQTITPTKETTLEGMLKAKYPNLKYHVFDASSSYWRTRNDYPHYLLYQDDIDTKAIENWKPSGENPFYGSIDGRFTAPKEIKALSSVPVGTTAVVIHPKVQERMENDPAYAKEIYDRIDKWFEFDKARNEAIMPGITARSSWCVAIGENGEIVNAQSHSSGRFTQSQSGTDAAFDFWTQRSLRHKYFMQLQLEGQLRHEMLLYGLTGTAKSSGLFDLAGGTLSAANLTGLMQLAQSYETPTLSALQLQEKAVAKAKLTAMLGSGELNILGDTVAGMPLKELISLTKQEASKNLF